MLLQVVVLWVGTNNHGHTPEQICEGIMAIIQVIKNKIPHANTLVLVGFFSDAESVNLLICSCNRPNAQFSPHLSFIS